jgi:hypothetical protein
MIEEQTKRPYYHWGYSEMEVGDTRTVYEPELFDKALANLRLTRRRYKDRLYRFGVVSGFFQVRRTK